MNDFKDNLLYRYDNKILRSLIQLVPFGIGSAIDTYLIEIINQNRHERLKIFYDGLANGKIELTEDLIKSEDFLHCYFLTIKAVLNTRRREKIIYIANLFSKTCESDAFKNVDEFENFLGILDEITFQELEILTILYNFEINNPPKVDGIISRLSANNKFWKDFKSVLIQKYNIDEEDIYAIMIRIERTGCLLYSRARANDYRSISGMTTNTFKKLVKLINKSC